MAGVGRPRPHILPLPSPLPQSGVEKAEVAIDEAKNLAAERNVSVEDAVNAVGVIESQLADLGVDDASSLVPGEVPETPVSFTETYLTVF